jgi:hypothetical protein
MSNYLCICSGVEAGVLTTLPPVEFQCPYLKQNKEKNDLIYCVNFPQHPYDICLLLMFSWHSMRTHNIFTVSLKCHFGSPWYFRTIEWRHSRLYPVKSFVYAITVRFVLILWNIRIRGSSVSIVSDYGLDDRTIEVRCPVEANNFSYNLCVQTGSGAHPASCTIGTGGHFPGVKRAGAWRWPLTPSNAEVMNE